ncbi:pseudouridine synthase [Candidatus Spongiihabitans sp.]|uniref:pseudouridine synthase n=1 Tax=Candidatus Spongiihabitans sp. TaxID=3101308 RepID=UPI003C6EDFA9
MPQYDAGLARERLQKYLSSIGVGSRRKIEECISRGKITVDGKIAKLGDRVTSSSRINIDGRPLKDHSKCHPKRKFGNKRHHRQKRIILYNKPEGEICTRSDPKNRPTVFRRLPVLKGERWVAVGRLDINTRGLLLFTNDGDLAHHLMHPKLGLEREYLCRVYGQVDNRSLDRLKQGIKIDGQLIRFLQVRRQRGERSNTWYSVTVKQGKYREVRRMWEAIGCKLSRLSRIRYGKVALPRGTKLGDWIELGSDLIEKLEKNDDNDKVVTPKPPKKSRQSSKKRRPHGRGR